MSRAEAAREAGASKPAHDATDYEYSRLSVDSLITFPDDGMYDTINVRVLVPDAEVGADGALLLSSPGVVARLTALRDAENERIGIEEAFATTRRMARRRRAAKAKREAQFRTIIAAQPDSVTAMALDNMLLREKPPPSIEASERE